LPNCHPTHSRDENGGVLVGQHSGSEKRVVGYHIDGEGKKGACSVDIGLFVRAWPRAKR
jgi:hypothetical protein